MLRGIDHIVIAVRELEAAVASYRQLGFTVLPGGRHPRGTHNALIAFADGAYVELLAFYEPSPDHRWWAPLERGGGLVDFCMQTDDLSADMAAFRRVGVAMEERGPGARTRPDGYQVRWILSVPPVGERGVAPFLIEDETPRAERVPRETGHANGVRGVGAVTVATSQVARVSGWFAGVLGRPGEEVKREDLQADGVRFGIGPHALEFLAPRGPASPLAGWLASRGPSPWGATLAAPAGRKGPLDAGLAQGARLTVA